MPNVEIRCPKCGSSEVERTKNQECRCLRVGKFFILLLRSVVLKLMIWKDTISDACDAFFHECLGEFCFWTINFI